MRFPLNLVFPFLKVLLEAIIRNNCLIHKKKMSRPRYWKPPRYYCTRIYYNINSRVLGSPVIVSDLLCPPSSIVDWLKRVWNLREYIIMILKINLFPFFRETICWWIFYSKNRFSKKKTYRKWTILIKEFWKISSSFRL